jgi:hypothetical protein
MATAVDNTEAAVHELHTRLERDEAFKTSVDRDPTTALRQAGMGALADAAERERDRLAGLATRYGEDPTFRERVDSDPLQVLAAEGVPHFAAEPFLRRAGAPAGVIDQVSPDVEAHLTQQQILTWSILVIALGAALFVAEAALFSDAASAPRCTFCG